MLLNWRYVYNVHNNINIFKFIEIVLVNFETYILIWCDCAVCALLVDMCGCFLYWCRWDVMARVPVGMFLLLLFAYIRARFCILSLCAYLPMYLSYTLSTRDSLIWFHFLWVRLSHDARYTYSCIYSSAPHTIPSARTNTNRNICCRSRQTREYSKVL